MLWMIWIVTGVAVGALSGELMKRGAVDRIGRVMICVVGATLVGWLLAFLQIQPGGPYLGALLAGAIGAALALVARFLYEMS